MARTESTAALAERLLHTDRMRGMSTADRRIVARHLEVLRVPAGTTLLREGDPATNVFFLFDGRVAVRESGVTWWLAPGRQVGEISMLRGAPSHQEVTTRADCELGVLGARMFQVLCRDLPPFTRAVLADLATVAFAGAASRPSRAERHAAAS
jgi:CRP-like cAMP-binding protein